MNHFYKTLCTVLLVVFAVASGLAQNVDLTSAEASLTNTPLPANAVISWHTGTPATDANRIIAGNTLEDATSVPVWDTYFVAYYDATNTCYSPATSVPTLANAIGETTADLTSLDSTINNNPGERNNPHHRHNDYKWSSTDNDPSKDPYKTQEDSDHNNERL